jgi:hypothetical protein
MHIKAPYTLIEVDLALPRMEQCWQVQVLHSVQLFTDLVKLVVDKFSS